MCLGGGGVWSKTTLLHFLGGDPSLKTFACVSLMYRKCPGVGIGDSGSGLW